MKKKRFLAGMLAAVLLFAAVPLPVFARAANNDKLDMKAKGTPTGVFSQLDISAAWGGATNPQSLIMRFDFALDDEKRAEFEDTEQIKFEIDYKLQDDILMPEQEIQGLCTTADDLHVAKYTVSKIESDERILRLACEIDMQAIEGKTNITAGQVFTLSIDNDNIESVTPSLAEKDGKVEVSVDIKEKPTAGGVDGLNYTLEKALTERESADPKFEYTITAAATAQDESKETPRLNGLTIRDTLPEGLVLDSVKLGDSTDALENTAYDYNAQTREFSYTVTQEYNEPNSAVPNVKLTLTAYVDTATYKAYIDNTSDTYKKEFKNTAELRDGNEKLPLAESAEVSGALSGAFFSKDGKVAGSNGKLYQWTITANTHFGSATKAYIVDMIPNTDVHMYENAADTVSFSLNNTTKSATQITPDQPTAYDKLTLGEITALTSTGGTGGSDDAVYYTVGEQAIMIIPVTPTEKVTITYKTELEPSDEKTPMLENRAKILWKIPEGDGPGKYEPPTGDIEKKVTANVSDIQKTGGKYDPKTQKLTWDFEINHAGVEMKNVVITDTLYDSKQTLVSITNKTDSANSDISKWDKNDAEPDKPYYIEIVDTDNHTHTYEIHLGTITAETLYQFSLTTKVVDPAVLSQQDAAVSGLTNKATMAYGPTDNRKEGSVEGTKTVPNTLITKTAVGTYDFTAHTLKWKITINPNSLTIKNAVLTDLLPAGNTFRSLDAVARGTTDATGNLIEAGKATAEVTDNKTFIFNDETAITCENETAESDQCYSKDTTTVSLGDIKQAYVFELTTTVDQNYRDAILRDLESHTVTNTAKLTGTIENKVVGQLGGEIKATATADHTITAPPVAKSGVYHKNDASKYPDLGNIDYITWTLVVNPDGVDMTGATIKDELYDWFELDTASLKIYKAVIDKAGEATQGDGITTPAGLTATEKGFEYEIPAALSRQPLILTFNTLVTDTAGAGDMKNTVSLVWSGGDNTKTPDAGAAGADEFDLGNYATATSAPLLRIKKVSANSDALPLSGAAFTLTKMKQDNGAWVADGAPKSKTTSARARAGVEGTASFLFLAADTLYKLEETAAPAGYETAAPQYFVFGGELPQGQYPENTTMLDANGNAYAKVHPIEDTPTGSLQFQKCVKSDGTAGAPLPNIGFTLTLNDSTVTPPIKHTATSDADGKVRFTALDPGTYTLTEDGKNDLSWTVTVTAGEATSITANNGAPLSGTAESGYTITNTITQADYGTVKGKKTTSSGAPLAGAVIGLFKGEETLAAYKATSGDDGTFTFSLVKPDSYTLREISAPAGYDLNDKTEFTVTVTENTETVKDHSNADIVIQNERTQTNTGGGGGGSSNGRLTIEKTSDDGAKQGFTFRIKGSGYDKTFVTNAAGKIEIAALATGTYTVTEVETGAAAHYEIPDGQTVKLTSKGATLAFHNKLKAELPPVDPNDPNKPVDPNDPNKPNDPTDPNKPTDPDQPADPGKPDGSGKPGGNTGVEGAAEGKTPSGGTSGGKTLLSPKTDYRSPLSLWLALAFLSAAGFALCAGRLRGKRYRGRHQRR